MLLFAGQYFVLQFVRAGFSEEYLKSYLIHLHFSPYLSYNSLMSNILQMI